MTSGHGLMAIRWLLALGILASGFGGFTAGGARAQEGGQGELETAALVPADSLLYVSINTDVSSDQWAIAADLLEQGGLEDVVYGAVAQLVAESGLPAEWISPGSSFLGDEVSVALVTGGPNGIDPVVLISSANPNQAFETARSAFSGEFSESLYISTSEDGVVTTLTEIGSEITLARIDDLIVLGTSFGVQQAVGVTYGAEPALADLETFDELVGELEEDRLATAWANGPALSASYGSLLGSAVSAGASFEETALLSPALNIADGAYQAVGIWAEEEGFRLDSRMLPGPRAEALTAPDGATELADRAPAEALLFVDGVDFGQITALQSYVDAIAFGFGAEAGYADLDSDDPFVAPTIEESYAALDDLLGFDLRADLIDQLTDDYGLWVSSSSLEDADDLSAVLVSGVGDPATVDASIDRLITLLRLEAGGDAAFNQIRVGDARVTEILIPDATPSGPLRVTVGVVDGQLLIGVGAGMEQYLDGPLEDPLAESPRFEAAFDALPDDDGGRLYLDLNTLIDLQDLSAIEPPDGMEDPQLASLDGIQALAAVTRMDDETQVTSVVLTIDAEAVDDPTTPEASPDTDASPVAGTGALAVTDVTPIDAGGARILAMSPTDGALLTFDGDTNDVCVVSAGGEEEACGGPIRSVDLLHVSWSPDGRRVAFTENAALYLMDSDIHVFDRDAGELQNWTDDGYDGDILSFGDDAPVSVPVDLTPSWTADGDAIAFGRTTNGSFESGLASTIVYTVAGPEAEPVRIAPAGLYPFATYNGMAYASDGRLIYTSTSAEIGDPATGLFELSADGRSVRQVLASSEETGPPYLIGLTDSGSALVVYRYLAGQFGSAGDDGACFLELVDLSTTARTPLKMPDGNCAVFAGASPDGATVVLARPNVISEGEVPLAVLDASDPGGGSVAVDTSAVPTESTMDGDELSGHYGWESSGLTVLEDGRVLLMSRPSEGVLLTLG